MRIAPQHVYFNMVNFQNFWNKKREGTCLGILVQHKCIQKEYDKLVLVAFHMYIERRESSEWYIDLHCIIQDLERPVVSRNRINHNISDLETVSNTETYMYIIMCTRMCHCMSHVQSYELCEIVMNSVKHWNTYMCVY